MKLKQGNIKYIDNWLQFSGINYMDVRYELVDHLVSEYEQSDQEISIESFVKNRLNWCKATAKKKESTMHWGVQKRLWRRFLSLFTEWKVIVPLVAYFILVLSLREGFSIRETRLLFLAPVFLTIGAFLYQAISQGYWSKKQGLNEKFLGLQKLQTLFALPHVFLTVFCYPSMWSINEGKIFDNIYIFLPCVFLISILNIAAIYEYTEGHKKLIGQIQKLMGSA